MILIIANARIRGGLSGGDNIYLHLAEHAGPHRIWDMMDTDFKPFVVCYVWKVLKSVFKALWCIERYEYVYSASDFWMDSLPAFILKLKGNPWVAGFYMFAPKKNKVFYYSQKPIKWLIDKYADVVCVTHESLLKFKKPSVVVRGGVDLQDAFIDDTKKIYDAIFVGRFHHTKGISELMQIWDMVLKDNPGAKLAIIGDGDDETVRLKAWAGYRPSVKMFGFLDKERFDICRQSKIVLYTTPLIYSHFSMAPIEAMACGCPLVSFKLPEMANLNENDGVLQVDDRENFALMINLIVRNYENLNTLKQSAVRYAQSWDWSVRAPEIIKQIKEKL